MKLSRPVKYGIAGIGLVLVFTIGLTVYSVSGSKKIGPTIAPDECEFCRGKLNKNGECPKCLAEMGAEKYRAKRESKNWYNSPVIALSVGGTLVVLVLIYIGVELRKYLKTRKKEVFFSTRCPKCGRKLRYRDTQVGHLGKCPLCMKPLRFPKQVLAPKPTVWSKLRGISWQRIREIVWD